MGHAGGHGDEAGPPFAPEVWDERRIESLGGPLISAANAAGIGLSVVRLDGPPRVVYITDRGVEILGHPREVILAQPATSFLTPAEQRARTAGEESARRGGTRTFETVALTADGRQVPIE